MELKRLAKRAMAAASPGRVPAIRGRARVGTFHKSGTVLWHKILMGLQTRCGLRVWISDEASAPTGWDVEFNWHSQFQSADAPTVIVVRDPRDVILSAARYHVWSEEAWLDDPDFKFDGPWRRQGRTYREAIKACPDKQAQQIFEMDNIGGLAVRRMLAAPLDAASSRVVKLEALMADVDLAEFRACFAHLGLNPAMAAQALTLAEANSVFSKDFKGGPHVQSGRPALWREAYDAPLRAAFETRFGDAPVRLGYPPFDG